MPATVHVQSIGNSRFSQQIQAGHHTLTGDEPVSVGGDDRGPTPYEFLLSALGTCTSLTLRMYADRKGMDLQQVRIELRHERIHASDCEDCETKSGMLDQIHTEIELIGDLDDGQRQRLREIAEKCPVHRTLTSEIRIRTSLAGAE